MNYAEKAGDREEDVRARVLSRIQLLATAWTVACQAPLSMGFPRQEYWRGLPLTSPGALPNPGIEPIPLALADRFFTPEPPGKTLHASYKPKQITGPSSESVWRGIHKSGQWNG